MLKQCYTCIHFVVAGKSLHYDLSQCKKFKTFTDIARMDVNKCGKHAKYFQNDKSKGYVDCTCFRHRQIR